MYSYVVLKIMNIQTVIGIFEQKLEFDRTLIGQILILTQTNFVRKYAFFAENHSSV